MDWFKKIFHVFKDGNDEQKETKTEHQPVSRRKHDHQEGAKDVSGRIAYHYPKGSIQAPTERDVLKNRENRPLRHANQHRRVRKEELGQESRVDSLESLRRFRPRQEQIKQVEPKLEKISEAEFVQPKPKRKPERIRYGPFRPTEIPSPIYGYERPQPRSTKIIEHELTGFFDFTQVEYERETAVSLETEQPKSAEVEVSGDLTNNTKEMQDEAMQTPTQEVEVCEEAIETNIDIRKIEIGSAEAKISEADRESKNVKSVEATKEPETVEVKSVEVAKEPETVEVEAVEVAKEPETVEVELGEVAKEPETVEVKSVEAAKELETVEVELGEVAKEQELAEVKLDEVETELESVEPELGEGKKEAEQVKIIKFPVQEKQPEQEPSKHVPNLESQGNVSEVQPNVTKSHIPFNVIMLKQDRQKLSIKNLISEQLVKSPKQFDDRSNESVVENKQQSVVINQQETLSSQQSAIDKQVIATNQQMEISQQETTPNQQDKQEAHFNLSNYQFPDQELLTPPVIQEENDEWLLEQEAFLNRTLNDFNVGAKVVNVTQGPSVTRFEVQPDPGVKVNKITNLQDDIKLNLAAKDIRMEAPIPGKHTIGIEVPNEKSRPVFISEIISSPEFIQNPSPLTAALGLDISGKPVVTDLRKMPHGLIAGATGSGKSVCINSILTSLLYKANPQEVKLLLIDPKMVELAPYNYIPHLVSPVITDVKAATAALKWAVEEMERRYELFVHTGVREISRFNELAENAKRYSDKLPYILIVIDELADLMMVAPGDVEEAICRIAQKARACGIHLIIATQRPSVDVITGLIKANIPTRIAFSVSSQIDSRTIIDIAGAEKLLGRGDMLFLENGTSKPVRLQGTYISDTEIDQVVEHVRSQAEPAYLFEQGELLKKAQIMEDEDELFFEACEFIVEQGVASTSSLQRRFKIGYNRAARLIDMMQSNGYISEARGSKPRDVLITEEDLDSLNSSSTIN